MTIYQRMLLSAGILRAPEGAAGGGTGDSGAGNAGGTGDSGQQQQQQQPPAGGWYERLTADPEAKAWADSKGWTKDTDTGIVADSYRNLEKLFGADKAGRTVVLPKDETDKAALDTIFDKLGKPKEAKEYEIEIPEGADPTFANTAKDWFHKNNLTKAQAKGITDLYKAAELDAVTAQTERHATEVEGLQTEWGAEFDKKVEIGKAAVKAAGLTEQHTLAIEKALGPASAAKMFEFFGRNYVEANPPGNEQRTTPSFANMNPAQASAKIDQLYQDQNFMARYNHHDPKVRASAMEEMEALSRLAVNAKAG